MDLNKSLNKREKKAVNEFAQKVKNSAVNNLINIKLFGSKARGEGKPGSDIDIYLLIKKISPEIRDQIYDIAFDLNLKYNVYISPRIISMDIYKNPIFKITSFIQSIEREGIPI